MELRSFYSFSKRRDHLSLKGIRESISQWLLSKYSKSRENGLMKTCFKLEKDFNKEKLICVFFESRCHSRCKIKKIIYQRDSVSWLIWSRVGSNVYTSPPPPKKKTNTNWKTSHFFHFKNSFKCMMHAWCMHDLPLKITLTWLTHEYVNIGHDKCLESYSRNNTDKIKSL